MSESTNNQHPSRIQSLALAAVALLAGVLFGIVAANVFTSGDQAADTEGQDQGITEAEAKLTADLQALSVAQLNLDFEYLVAVYEQDSSREFLEQTTEDHMEELAATIGQVAGEEASTDLIEYWTEAREKQVDYMARARDGEAMDVIEASNAVETSFGALSGSQTDALGLDAGEVESDLQEFAQSWQQALDSHIAGNYQESLQSRQTATEQARSLARDVSESLAETHPEALE